MGVKYDTENSSVDTGVHRTKSESYVHAFPLAKCPSAEVEFTFLCILLVFSLCVSKNIYIHIHLRVLFLNLNVSCFTFNSEICIFQFTIYFGNLMSVYRFTSFLKTTV